MYTVHIYIYIFIVEVPFNRQLVCNRIAFASKSIFSSQKLISISNKFPLSFKLQNIYKLYLMHSVVMSYCRIIWSSASSQRAAFVIQFRKLNQKQQFQNKFHNISVWYNLLHSLCVCAREFGLLFIFSGFACCLFGSCFVIFGKNVNFAFNKYLNSGYLGHEIQTILYLRHVSVHI